MLYVFQNIMKVAYNEARPFWRDATLFRNDCSSEFGNPSGHAMTAFLLSFAFVFELSELIM
jgi:membrane-associated phospholipid phosphatase